MADKFWENAPIVNDSEPAQVPGSVFIPNRAGQRDEARENARLRIAQEQAENARASEARAEQKFAREEKAAAITGGVDTAEAERTAAFLATRVAGGLQTLSQFKDTGPEIDAAIAGTFGETARNAFNSEDRQRIEAAQLDVLDAALTLGTGAAYTKEQLEGYRRSYFPQLLDEPATIADKRRRLGLMLEAARVKAGAAAPQIDKALQAAGFAPASAEDQGDEVAGARGLPRAAGAHDQGGADIDGVTPKGQGFRPEPGLYHLGDTVADMIGKGASIEDVTAYLAQEYGRYGVGAGTELEGVLGSVIRAHKADPSKPVKSLVSGWDALHLIPDTAETPWYSSIADSPIGAGALGVADVGTMGFGDEIAGAIGGDELNAAWDYSREERPLSYGAGQLTGAFLLPTGAGGAARQAGTSALRAGEGMNAARAAAASAATRRMTAEGAAYGTVHGAGAADGDLGGRLAGAAVEGSLGALGGRVVGKVGEKVATRAPRAAGAPASDAAEYAAAAQRQDIVPFAPDMNPRVAAATGKVAQTQAGVGRITDRAKLTLDSAKAARDRIARSIGTPQEGESLGYRVAEGAKAAIKREHDKGAALYRTAERAAGDARIRPVDAFQTLSDEIDAMAETGLSETAGNIFKRVRDRMTEGPMTVQALRDVRTNLREDLATFNVRGGVSSARAKRVMDAITKDIDDGLRGQGLEDAADTFQRADGQWQSYIDLTDNVVTPLIGKDGSASGEQVTKRLMADLQGNNARAVKLLNALPAEEQAIARASVIQALGRASKGRQNAEGDAFSLSDFLTHWDTMGETAKLAYFGRDARAALNDLAKVAEGSKASQRFANHSNSGGAINAIPEVGLGLATAGMSALATNVTARMLTSQRMVRWLAGAGKKPNPAASAAHVERLSAIAKAEPALANDILGLQSILQQQLSGAGTRSVGRAYAEEEENPGREKPAEGKRDGAQ